MPRPLRADEKGGLYHALNRGNVRQDLFRKPADFEAFECILAEGLARYAVSLYAYQLMSNHWHLVLRPKADGEMSRFLRWVTATHTMRLHAQYHTAGEGHVYQGRFKSFPVQNDEHFLAVCRYVERNALRAGLVRKAENYRWGSLWRRRQPTEPEPALLTDWPRPRPRNWLARVNAPMTPGELDGLRLSVRRGRPYGDAAWIARQARRLGLESTLRPRGRPRNASPGAVK